MKLSGINHQETVDYAKSILNFESLGHRVYYKKLSKGLYRQALEIQVYEKPNRQLEQMVFGLYINCLVKCGGKIENYINILKDYELENG